MIYIRNILTGVETEVPDSDNSEVIFSALPGHKYESRICVRGHLVAGVKVVGDNGLTIYPDGTDTLRIHSGFGRK